MCVCVCVCVCVFVCVCVCTQPACCCTVLGQHVVVLWPQFLSGRYEANWPIVIQIVTPRYHQSPVQDITGCYETKDITFLQMTSAVPVI